MTRLLLVGIYAGLDWLADHIRAAMERFDTAICDASDQLGEDDDA